MKKILYAVLVIAVVSFVGYSVGQERAASMSALLLANVEALANDESDSGEYIRFSWRDGGTVEENECYVITHYIEHVRCMLGGTENCFPSDTQLEEKMKKADCPG